VAVERADVVVIGAGPAGLAVAACLKRRGIEPVVVEATGQVGTSWRNHYKRLHLHTVKHLSHLPEMEMPSYYDRYPTRQQVVNYLERYAQHFHIQPRFAWPVGRASRSEERWLVEGPGDQALSAKHLVVCTGYNRTPNLPMFEGSFAGPMVHSSSYRDGSPYRDQDVLVVGCGNSGAEIALDLFEHGARPHLVVRSPIHVLPRDLLGRPSQETAVAMRRLPVGARDRIAGWMLKWAVGDLRRWGIERPAKGPVRLIVEEGRVSMLDVGTLALIKSGDIQVRVGVTRLDGHDVGFADGTTGRFDGIVLATGYKATLGDFLDGAADLVNDRGFPTRFGGNAAAPGLFFVGYKNPPTGALREMGIEAGEVAKAIAG
jgi:indole-3-pyruvate monooxygenase